jgi:AcrR family transcriptional regulator
VPPALRPRAIRLSADGILEAAERLFAARGYSEVSLRQLIAAAGVSTTAFYARFDSKDDVLIELAERFFADLHTAAAQSLGQVRDLDEGIDRGVDVLCDHLAARKAIVRLVVAESGSSLPTLATRRRSYGMLVGFLADRFAALAARGRIVVTDPVALGWALVGALEMQIVRWAVWDELDLTALRASLRATSRAILPPAIRPKEAP